MVLAPEIYSKLWRTRSRCQATWFLGRVDNLRGFQKILLLYFHLPDINHLSHNLILAFLRVLPSLSDDLHKVLFPNAVTLGIRASTWKWEQEWHKHSVGSKGYKSNLLGLSNRQMFWAEMIHLSYIRKKREAGPCPMSQQKIFAEVRLVA